MRGEKQIYSVMAAIRTEAYNDKLAFDYFDLIKAQDKEEFDAYIAGAKQAALYDTGLTPRYGDSLLTLSTCAYHTAHGRFVVLAFAKKIPPIGSSG